MVVMARKFGTRKRISFVRLPSRRGDDGRCSDLAAQCSQTCRSVERDHKELLSERKRQAREDLLDCLTSDAGCKKVFSSKKERWENMAKFAFKYGR